MSDRQQTPEFDPDRTVLNEGARPIVNAYIPGDLIQQPEAPKQQPAAIDIMKGGATVVYEAFEPYGNPSVAAGDNIDKVFTIQHSKNWDLYISKLTYVEDLEGNLVPRAALLTKAGKELFLRNPHTLRAINDHTLLERNSMLETVWTKNSRSGDVSIGQLADGSPVAIKRYKRFQDGRMLHVRGLEQAQAHINLEEILNAAGEPFRPASIYYASQDVVVLEDIEDRTPIDVFLEQHPNMKERVLEQIIEAEDIIQQAFDTGDVLGNFERFTTVLRGERMFSGATFKHIFIDSFNDETKEIRYVFIDPNV